MPILIVNLILCVIILVLGILGYIKQKGDVPLYIGFAFGLFGVSNLLNIVGLEQDMSALIIAIRIIAYILVIFALFRLISRK
ncbi:MAG: hypothetical protein P8105_10750 [Dehalococcoidia bacterium]